MDEQQKDLLRFAPVSTQRLCTPSRATWWRWSTGKTRVPVAVLVLLRLLVAGELPQGGKPWAGWRFNLKRGCLTDPQGVEHTPETILAWWWTARRLQERRREENEILRDPPANVVLLDSARPAHRITRELNRRLAD